jgi:exodeoxyribonuclease V beta subunit
MLHTLFENIDFTQPWGDEQKTLVNDQLLKYGFDIEWLPVLERMISDVLNTELDSESGLALSKISEKQKLVELEFYFPLAQLNAEKLNALLIEHGHDWLTEAGLGFIPHQGMMTGFVDLVFEYQGQYFIADYKSNHLGDSLDCYGDDQLQQAMIEHQYPLQYLIYSVALHRYLKHRLPGYDYHQHMGGAYYLFLRGMRPGQGDTSGVFFDKPSLALIEALDQLFSGGQG